MAEESGHPYQFLTPDLVLDAVESAGFVVNGRLFPLNSYENRVYQVGIEGSEPLIAKFYRPNRWSHQQLEEEHSFVAELAEGEIPVVAALALPGGGYLGQWKGFTFALYPQRGGQAPDISMPDTLYRLGQWLGRLHRIGSLTPFRHRPTMDIPGTLRENQQLLLDSGFIPEDLRLPYSTLMEDLIPRVERRLADAGDWQSLRLHGDFHLGNILMRDERIMLVDFDDTRQGPAMQDIWLLLSGELQEQQMQFAEIIEGYEQFNEFNPRERFLVEPLRTYRVVSQAAWLARRWDDPTFPQHFPWFAHARYWSDHILMLREQLSGLDSPPLQLPGQ
ncbi:MAG: serine/threonine protein kinase [Oleiphilaceae bacterium]|nr:serine/threonine protein kinase [Oleiphilaceae bacterium]